MPQTRTTQLWTSPVRATSGHVRRILIVALATLMVVAAAAIAPNARADAAPVNTNDPDYWETQTTHESRCFKHEVGAQTAHGAITDDGYTVTLNPYNPSWWGDHWELLVVKAGAGDGSNLVTDHPSAGVAYPAPDGREVSHWIVCKGENPPPPELGSIVVEKLTVPDGDATLFTFTGDASGPISDGEQITVTDLAPGEYTSTETVPAGWDLTSITCDEGATGDLASKTATFNIDGSETLKCTFTNEKQPPPELGSIVVEKQTVPDGDATLFTFTGDASGPISDGEQITVTDLAPGEYTSTETVPAGWDLTSITCDEGATGDLASKTATFNIDGSETLKCTFTNEKQPPPELGSIVVEKQTVPDGDATLFTFTGDAAGEISDGEQITVTDLAPGEYTSTETVPAGWDLTSITCDEGATGDLASKTATFNIDGSETLKCTFTNEKQPPPDGPDIDIEKATNGENADDPTGPRIRVGSTVTWTYVVTNTGDVPLEDVTVTDDQAGVTPVYQSGDTNSDGVLDLGEVWTYKATGVAVVGQYKNTGKVTGFYPQGEEEVDDTDPSHYFGYRRTTNPDDPDIDIEKATNGEDADTPALGPVLKVGDPVTWTYVVTNTGDVTLTNVEVTDDQAGVTPVYQSGDTNNNTLLDLGETWIYKATGTAILGQYANMGTVTGSHGSSIVTDTDPSHYSGAAVAGTAQLGDTVWLDVNKNGVQDSGEVGYNGADVILKDADGAVVGTLTTATGPWVGFYKFVGLDAGTYTAMLDLSTIGTYEVSTATAFTVTLAEGDEYLDADFGLYEDAAPPTTVPPEETLPTTGADTDGLAMLAASLLILGALAVLATRKRRIEDQ